MYQRILIATDGSTLSRKAVNSGIKLAELTGAQVIALNVVPRYPLAYFEGGLSASTSDVARIEKQWSESAQAVVDAVKVAAESIIAAAKKHKCALIVMASHGRRGLKRLLLGSETTHVLTHSHIPVLVLR